MKLILSTIAITIALLIIIGITFPIYTIGVLISNVTILADILSTALFMSMFIILFAVMALVAAEWQEPTKSLLKRILVICTSIIIISIIIRPFIPETKEAAMVLIGAQVVYDSDTARDIAHSSADIIKSSVNIFSAKLSKYEADLNITK